MTESADASTGFVGITGALSAGRMLREARQAQGLHIAALATSIKVTPRKLELLESDRVDELPDPAFTRALAQTVCRALKIDPAPVLKLLPAVSDRRLETVGEGLNTPFRDRPGQFVPNDWSVLQSPAVWGTLILVLAALAIWLAPMGFFERATSGLNAARDRSASASSPGASLVNEGGTTSPLADTPSGVGSLPMTAIGETAALSRSAGATSAPALTPFSQPATSMPGDDRSIGTRGVAGRDLADSTSSASPPPRAAPSTLPVARAATGLLQLRTTGASWVEVTDARGQSLLARLLQPGEAVGVDGVTPLKVRIGNASGTELSFRGQPLALTSYTRDNVARLDLK